MASEHLLQENYRSPVPLSTLIQLEKYVLNIYNTVLYLSISTAKTANIQSLPLLNTQAQALKGGSSVEAYAPIKFRVSPLMGKGKNSAPL